jgi:hypothetical protein
MNANEAADLPSSAAWPSPGTTAYSGNPVALHHPNVCFRLERHRGNGYWARSSSNSPVAFMLGRPSSQRHTNGQITVKACCPRMCATQIPGAQGRTVVRSSDPTDVLPVDYR